MSPLAIIEHFNVIEYISLGFFTCSVVFVMNQFGLEFAEETLHGRVVPADSLASRAMDF